MIELLKPYQRNFGNLKSVIPLTSYSKIFKIKDGAEKVTSGRLISILNNRPHLRPKALLSTKSRQNRLIFSKVHVSHRPFSKKQFLQEMTNFRSIFQY